MLIGGGRAPSEANLKRRSRTDVRPPPINACLHTTCLSPPPQPKPAAATPPSHPRASHDAAKAAAALSFSSFNHVSSIGRCSRRNHRSRKPTPSTHNSSTPQVRDHKPPRAAPTRQPPHNASRGHWEPGDTRRRLAPAPHTPARHAFAFRQSCRCPQFAIAGGSVCARAPPPGRTAPHAPASHPLPTPTPHAPAFAPHAFPE